MAVKGAIAQSFTLPAIIKKLISVDGDGRPVDTSGGEDYENDVKIKEGAFVTAIDLFF